MSCCGKARMQATTSTTPSRIASDSSSPRFEYTGEQPLTISSPVSGLRYHFAMRGAVVRVDPRDRSYFLGIAAVRPV